MTREENIRAILECNFAGFKDDIIDIAVKRICEIEQEPKFIAKADGTIEQIKDCEDCLFKREWDKIGKLISAVVLGKQTEQEPILDKIRAEIADLDDADYDYEGYYKAVTDALQVIDKYRNGGE